MGKNEPCCIALLFCYCTQMEIPADILLIDKPTGITSFDVIRRLRMQYKAQGLMAPKMGHAGTLDPLASGLMIIGVGTGTKKLQNYLKLPKVYEASILVGETRTTGDMEGEIVSEKEVKEPIPQEKIQETLAHMIGHLELPVSAYSAIKKDGVPMYKRARKAEKRVQQSRTCLCELWKLQTFLCLGMRSLYSKVSIDFLYMFALG